MAQNKTEKRGAAKALAAVRDPKKYKGFFSEFKEFISRGSVIDLAVGMIIGAAFTAIVTSLVNDIIMPILGIFIGGINFSQLKWVIAPATATSAEVAIAYGSFINAIINFLAIALVIFLIIKLINGMRTKLFKQAEEDAEEEAASAADASPADELQLLTEIRDALVDREA